MKQRENLLGKILGLKNVRVRCFGVKEFYKLVYRSCNIAARCKFVDPKVADWLTNTESPEKSFYAMVRLVFANFSSPNYITH